jgi:hypothetical protein
MICERTGDPLAAAIAARSTLDLLRIKSEAVWLARPGSTEENT